MRQTTADATGLRGFDIVELLAEQGELRAAELASTLRISRPTLYRTLAALQRRGYVTRVASTRTFRVGPAALQLARRAEPNLIAPIAHDALTRLRDETGETANFAVRAGHRLFYAEILHSSFSLRPSAKVGEEVAPHATAVGKAVIASLGSADRADMLGAEPYTRFTQQTLTTADELEVELERTRERGYAIDLGEIEVGASCVAAAVLGVDDLPVGALSVAGATARMENAIPAVGALVSQLAQTVSADYRRRLRGKAAAPAASNKREEEV